MTTPESMRMMPEPLRAGIQSSLLSHGADDQIAADIASTLVRASLRGIDSHGVDLLPRIIKRAKAGRCRLDRPLTPAIDDPSAACTVFEAELAPGQHAGMAMARAAVARAKDRGIGMACVRNSTHFGAAEPYVAYIVESGLVGFVGSNSTPSMAAFGATHPNLGNNPLGFGAPVSDGPDMIFDFSCGVMSFGRLAKIRAAGDPVPSDAFIKPTGTPQDGPVYEVAGDLEYAALPFGGYKGASIAVMVEVLAGVLSGGYFGMATETMDGDVFRGPSHFAMAFAPEAFGTNDFADRMRVFLEGMGAGADEVRVPGAASDQTQMVRSIDGIVVSDGVRAVLDGG